MKNKVNKNKIFVSVFFGILVVFLFLLFMDYCYYLNVYNGYIRDLYQYAGNNTSSAFYSLYLSYSCNVADYAIKLICVLGLLGCLITAYIFYIKGFSSYLKLGFILLFSYFIFLNLLVAVDCLFNITYNSQLIKSSGGYADDAIPFFCPVGHYTKLLILTCFLIVIFTTILLWYIRKYVVIRDSNSLHEKMKRLQAKEAKLQQEIDNLPENEVLSNGVAEREEADKEVAFADHVATSPYSDSSPYATFDDNQASSTQTDSSPFEQPYETNEDSTVKPDATAKENSEPQEDNKGNDRAEPKEGNAENNEGSNTEDNKDSKSKDHTEGKAEE
jgi:hypothetical protein